MDDNEKRAHHEDRLSLDKAASNEFRPIPNVIPNFPYFGNEGYSFTENEIRNIPHMVTSINGPLDGPPQPMPYITTIVQPVGLTMTSSIQPSQQRIVYAQQQVQGVAFRPYVNQIYCQEFASASPNPYQSNVRYPGPGLTRESTAATQQSSNRGKPGSRYGMPSEAPRNSSSSSIPWEDKNCRPYDLLLQPEAVRVFKENKKTTPSKDKFPDERFQNNPDAPRSKKYDSKHDVSVHIGGILTLPKNNSMYNEDSSQNSSGSSMKDDSFKLCSMQPDIVRFRKLALDGFVELKRVIVKYGVKSGKEDLGALCDEVSGALRTPSTGVVQMETVFREIILAYVSICSSWTTLVGVLPTMTELQHPLEECVSPLIKEFHKWQDVSTSMLKRILETIDALPTEHERCISGFARSSVESRKREPENEPVVWEDGDKCTDEYKMLSPKIPAETPINYSPLPGFIYQTYPGWETPLAVPRIEQSPSLDLNDPMWAHLYPQLDSD